MSVQMTYFDSILVEGGIPLYQGKISAIMTINYHIMEICTLRFQESCKLLSLHLTEVSVTFVISRMHIGLNFKMASPLSALFSRLLTTKVR